MNPNPTKTRDAELLARYGVREPKKGNPADMAWGDRRGTVGPERIPEGEMEPEPLRPPVGGRRLT